MKSALLAVSALVGVGALAFTSHHGPQGLSCDITRTTTAFGQRYDHTPRSERVTVLIALEGDHWRAVSVDGHLIPEDQRKSLPLRVTATAYFLSEASQSKLADFQIESDGWTIERATGAFAAVDRTRSTKPGDDYSDIETRTGHCEPISLEAKF